MGVSDEGVFFDEALMVESVGTDNTEASTPGDQNNGEPVAATSPDVNTLLGLNPTVVRSNPSTNSVDTTNATHKVARTQDPQDNQARDLISTDSTATAIHYYRVHLNLTLSILGLLQ